MSSTPEIHENVGGWGPVTPTMVEHLARTRPWVLVIAVMFVINFAMMELVALVMLLVGAGGLAGAKGAEELPGMAFGFIAAVIYGVLGFFYLAFGLLVWRYASAIKRILAVSDTPSATVAIEGALARQRQFWMVSGIVCLVGVGLAIVGLLAMVAIGIAGAMASGG